MRIPYWLLRLLPMWDHVCPKCKREVKQKSRNCIHCGENYGLPLRVPPKLLKDPKKLEDYIHKHVFPKISASQREYLTQFFTVLFSNGFEDTVSPFGWSGTSFSAGCSVTAESTYPHHGSYGLKSYMPLGSPVGSGAVVYYGSLAGAYSHVFVRAMNVRFDVLPEDVNDIHGIIGFWEATNANNIAQAGCINSAGTVYWGIRRRSALAFANVVGANTPVINTNYCLEFEIVQSTVGNSDGAVRLYVNGILEVESTGLDNDDRALNYVLFGVYGANGPDLSNLNVHGDCVVVADAYIGPEVEVAAFKGWESWWYDSQPFIRTARPWASRLPKFSPHIVC